MGSACERVRAPPVSTVDTSKVRQNDDKGKGSPKHCKDVDASSRPCPRMDGTRRWKASAEGRRGGDRTDPTYLLHHPASEEGIKMRRFQESQCSGEEFEEGQVECSLPPLEGPRHFAHETAQRIEKWKAASAAYGAQLQVA